MSSDFKGLQSLSERAQFQLNLRLQCLPRLSHFQLFVVFWVGALVRKLHYSFAVRSRLKIELRRRQQTFSQLLQVSQSQWMTFSSIAKSLQHS